MKKTNFKLIKFFALIFVLIPCLFTFSACSISLGNQTNASITISDDGYWIINGTKTTTKAEGKDGKDAPQFTIKDAYDELVREGYDKTFAEFLREYFSTSIDLSAQIAQECKKSVVAISINSGSKNGSGVVFLKENNAAYIITNNHVVNPNASLNSISVYLADDDIKENPISATFVTKNEDYDLAIIKVENNALINNLEVATFANQNAKAGQSCIAIGNTHSKGIAVTIGSVSKELEEISYIVNGPKYEVLRHCAYIEKGSSGGGLFNLAGELIGITNAGETGDTTLMNYAIPVEHVNEFINNFINN